MREETDEQQNKQMKEFLPTWTGTERPVASCSFSLHSCSASFIQSTKFPL